ncbi:NAD-dependent epimerase/dehydratase family protein [Streptomyces triticagri]|uniref:NAD-dependent epimerase/dehydratase family protein n=1 Tax=Streptomyces triticagri TaxID=2293568 RepID=UPI001F3D7D84|nr:NAD-dependent epimerase/dehydratase family protein [Streptomyces triticagri]
MGGTGFTGGAIVRHLTSPGGTRTGGGSTPPVRVLARQPAEPAPGTEQVSADLTDPRSLRGSCAGVDTIIHAASYVGSDAKRCHDVNYAGTQALLEEAATAGVRSVVYISTTAVYGHGPHRGPDETALTPAPVSAASRWRLAAERAVLDTDAEGVILRPHLVHGHGDRHVLPVLAQLLRRVGGLPDGVSGRSSMVCVDDLARVAVALARSPTEQGAGGAVHHVAHPRPVRMHDVLDALSRTLGLPPGPALTAAEHRRRTTEFMPRLSDHQYALLTQDHWYDSSSIWRRTGLDPGPGFEARFAAAAEWYARTLGAGRQ